jgi:hypothetical protein
MKKKKYSDSTVINVKHWLSRGKTKKWVMELFGLTYRQLNNIIQQPLSNS